MDREVLPNPGPSCFMCRRCFVDAEKAAKCLDSGITMVNSFRYKLKLQPAIGIVQLNTNPGPVSTSSDSEASLATSEVPHPPTTQSHTPSTLRKRKSTSGSPFPKRIRHSLSFTPTSGPVDASSSPLMQVCYYGELFVYIVNSL